MFEDFSYSDLLNYDIYELEDNENFEEKLEIYNELVSLGSDKAYKEFRKEKRETKKTEKRESNYLDYDAIFDEYVEELIQNHDLSSWHELATEKEHDNYFLFMANKGINYFWGSQPCIEFQSKLIAATMAINSAAMPNLGAKWRKEIQLPIININGNSRTGKTYLGSLYFIPHDINNILLLMADTSGASIREDIHKICYRDDNYIPSVILFDNFTKEYLKELGKFGLILLKVLKSQAHSKKFIDGINTKLSCHTLKILTTVQSIADFTNEWKELELRMLSIFSTYVDNFNSIASYDFNDVPEQYNNLWAKEAYKEFLNKWLYPCTQLTPKDFNFAPEYQAQTVLTMATGCHVGIWSSIAEAIDYFSEYWQFVEKRKGTKSSELILIVDNYIKEHIDHLIEHYDEFKKDVLYDSDTDECLTEFSLSDIAIYIRQNRSISTLSSTEMNQVTAYLGSIGWESKIKSSGVNFRKRWD